MIHCIDFSIPKLIYIIDPGEVFSPWTKDKIARLSSVPQNSAEVEVQEYLSFPKLSHIDYGGGVFGKNDLSLFSYCSYEQALKMKALL